MKQRPKLSLERSKDLVRVSAEGLPALMITVTVCLLLALFVWFKVIFGS